MQIAIHQTKGSFSERWISYCNEHAIPYKIVDCYRNDIISQLSDCSALMWHFHHANAKDFLFAKQLLYSVQLSGKKVFPDFNTVWHFDDKVGQKYLLESIGAPLVKSYVFYSKKEAVEWSKTAVYPKVFKLRGGAGSVNVQLAKNASDAIRFIETAFGEGFKSDSVVPLKEVLKKYRRKRANATAVLKSIARSFIPTEFGKIRGRERGYAYFQDFIANNDHDIRVIVIGGKAFAIKRMTRENDFRASGSGIILYDKANFDEDTIRLSQQLTRKLKAQCVSFDFVYDNGKPLLVEISYGFYAPVYYPCTGYWDENLQWYEGSFNPYGWMVELATTI
jgi:glutathione synthase/RimK-type ligase-like ATP-grasp enzyme